MPVQPGSAKVRSAALGDQATEPDTVSDCPAEAAADPAVAATAPAKPAAPANAAAAATAAGPATAAARLAQQAMLAEVAALTTARLAEVSAQASARLTEVAAQASARLAEAAQTIALPAPAARETCPAADALPNTGSPTRNGNGSGSSVVKAGVTDAFPATATAAAAVPVKANPAADASPATATATAADPVRAKPTAVAPTAEPTTTAAPATPAADRKAHWRAPGLDGLRALAVLAVLAFHENLPWFHGGFLGVDVFFVLSGYLITDLLAARFARDGHVGLGTFWLRRARRLLPALALMIVTVTAAIAVLEPGQMAALRPALLGAISYTSNWWQAFAHQSYFAQFGPPPPLQHLWSLAVEEQFYLIWPLVMAAVLIAVRRPVQRAMVAWIGALASALAMLAIYVPGSDPSLVYYGTDTHASALMIGAALALTWPLAKVAAAAKPLRRWLDVCGAVGLAILCWAVWHFSGANPAVYPFGLVLAALAAGGVVLAAAAPGKVGTVLAWRPLRWLGIRSYGIYLWHWPVIAITAGLAGQAASSVTARIADAALPIALAAGSWHWLEEPILRNGMRADLRHRSRQLRLSVTGAWRRPAAALPLLGTLAMLALVGTAGYGIVQRQSGPTLEEQIAHGAQISALTQTDQADPPSQLVGQYDQWWIRAVGIGPYRVDRSRRARPARVPGWKAMAIGDSVMLASAPELAEALPGIYINAKVSRSMIAGVSIIQQLAADRRLRPVVIVGLGTNGPVSLYQIHQLRAAIGNSRWLVLINVFEQRPWESEVNTTLAAAASRYPNVLLVNWHRAIEHHTGLLWSDGIHPQPSGGKLYARVVRAVVMAALRHRPMPRHPRQPPNPGYPLHASDARL